MKIILYAAITFSTGALASCADNKGRYVDLNTGDRLELKKDDQTGLMVDAATGKPVEIYVDRESKDTIWGATGKVVNGKVVKSGEGKWVYEDGGTMKDDGDGEYKIKDGDYKKKVEDDGDIKIKDGDKKIKIDGETGERKVKND